jgi:hypothetical protein
MQNKTPWARVALWGVLGFPALIAAPCDLPRIACVADALSELPVTVHIIPIGASDLWASSKVVNFGGTVTVQVLHPPLSGFDRYAKRAFDICIAIPALLVFSPLLLAVAAAIKLDSRGSILFRQTRHGYNYEVIKVTQELPGSALRLCTFDLLRCDAGRNVNRCCCR